MCVAAFSSLVWHGASCTINLGKEDHFSMRKIVKKQSQYETVQLSFRGEENVGSEQQCLLRTHIWAWRAQRADSVRPQW